MVEFTLTTDPSGKRRAEVVNIRNAMMGGPMGGIPGYPMGGMSGYPPYGMMPQYPPQGYPLQGYGGGYPPQQQQQQPPMPGGYPQQQQPQQAYAQPAQLQPAYTAPLPDGRSSGVILRWNERGFGFLKCDQDGEETFVHASAIQNAMSTPAKLAVGARVEFTLSSDPQGKRRAEMVTEVADNPPAAHGQQHGQQAYQPQPVYGQAAEASGWQTLQDDQRRTYYFNPTTGVSQWEKP
jgi:cold shock CspA family protein